MQDFKSKGRKKRVKLQIPFKLRGGPVAGSTIQLYGKTYYLKGRHIFYRNAEKEARVLLHKGFRVKIRKEASVLGDWLVYYAPKLK